MAETRCLMLELDRIRTDGGTQPRAEIDQETVLHYAERLGAGVEFPPLVVFRDPEGFCWLASGFHRLEGYRFLGRSHAPCEVREGTLAEARIFAAGTNGTHGLRRSQPDMRLAVWLVRQDGAGKDWDVERVAKHCHVPMSLVKAMDVSSSWAPRPGLFGPDESDRPPAPDHAGEAPTITRERVRRSLRKVIRFAAILGCDAEELAREILAEEMAKVRAAAEIRARREAERTPGEVAEGPPAPAVDPAARDRCWWLVDGEPCGEEIAYWVGGADPDEWAYCCVGHLDQVRCEGDRVVPIGEMRAEEGSVAVPTPP